MSEASKNWKLIRPLLRGLPLIAAVMVVCLVIAELYLKHAMPTYESTAKIRLADPHQGEGSANLYKDFDVFATTNLISTEVEMLKSHVILAKTLDSMDMQTIIYRVGILMKSELYRDAPFHAIITIKDKQWYGKPFKLIVGTKDEYLLTAPESKVPVRGKFDKPLSLDGAEVLILKNDSLLRGQPDSLLLGRFEIKTYGREEAIKKLTDALDITSIDKDVPILRIIYKSNNAEKAADYVNILANTYITDYVETKVRSADITVKFLDKQLEDMGGKLALSENNIEGFRTGEHIVNIQQETETDLRKIAELKIQLTNMKMNMIALDTLNRYIEAGKNDFLSLAPNFEAFTDLLSTELIKKIKELQAEREDLLLKYTDRDEKVRVIDEKLKDITSYLLESIKNTRRNYEVKYSEIEGAIQDAEKAFVGLPTKEKTMAILEREFDLNEKNYDFLHQKMTEAEIARAATVSFHRIIAPGVVPEKPASPNKILILAISAIMGLLIAISTIYAVHGAKAKVNDTSTIEKNSETPLIAEVRRQKKETDRQAHFNDLAIQLELRKVINYPAVVTYSSFEDKEGKSYNAVNISRGLVALGKKVLLVDVNGNIPIKQGWDIYQPDDRGIYETPVDNLFYYRADGGAPGDVVIRKELEGRIWEWKQLYDAIIIRNQPLLLSAGALVYMSVADANLFILDSRRTAAKKIMQADLLKEKYQFPGMWFVLNRAFYNPSLIVEGVERIRSFRNKYRRRP